MGYKRGGDGKVRVGIMDVLITEVGAIVPGPREKFEVGLSIGDNVPNIQGISRVIGKAEVRRVRDWSASGNEGVRSKSTPRWAGRGTGGMRVSCNEKTLKQGTEPRHD